MIEFKYEMSCKTQEKAVIMNILKRLLCMVFALTMCLGLAHPVAAKEQPLSETEPTVEIFDFKQVCEDQLQAEPRIFVVEIVLYFLGTAVATAVKEAGKWVLKKIVSTVRGWITAAFLAAIVEINNAEPSEISDMYFLYNAEYDQHYVVSYETKSGNECTRPDSFSSWTCKFSLA